MSSVLNCNQKARDPQSGVEGHITYLRLILRMIIKKRINGRNVQMKRFLD